jgi:S-adenosylmethionine:tRNA ribosyltransferase-isomerase
MEIEHKIKTESFFYYLPPELIAQQPLPERDSSRLLVLSRSSGEIEDSVFKRLPFYLKTGDLLILNNTRVLPARLLGRRKDTGGQIELLLLRRLSEEEEQWEALCSPGRRARPGAVLTFGNGQLEAEVLEKTPVGGRVVLFKAEQPLKELLYKLGRVPLPPYIKKNLEDDGRYQTIYASEDGSAAAPTAGLHFTPAVFAKLKARGIEWAYLTLHIGLGTFRPVKEKYVENHLMHSEYFELPASTAQKVNRTREMGGRVIAVGTTCCRVLETLGNSRGEVSAGRGETDLFIYPGYNFKVVDALITNFHLPCSTLLMLVCAFAGRENILKAYEKAVEMRYRFYSFGDAMLII